MSALATDTPSAIDLRAIPPRDRHAFIFGRFDALQPGQSLALINDHNPQPLRAQFDDLAAGSYFVCFDLTTLPVGYEVTTQNAGRIRNARLR